jgi:hypothetical protein
MKHSYKQKFERYRSLTYRLVCGNHKWMKESPVLCLSTGGSRHVSCVDPSSCNTPVLNTEPLNDAFKCQYSVILESKMMRQYVGPTTPVKFSEILHLSHIV